MTGSMCVGEQGGRREARRGSWRGRTESGKGTERRGRSRGEGEQSDPNAQEKKLVSAEVRSSRSGDRGANAKSPAKSSSWLTEVKEKGRPRRRLK